MDYLSARNQIKTGDLVAVWGSHGIPATLTHFFTYSPYSHTGVAIWIGEHLFLADLNSGHNSLHAMSQFNSFDVFDPPAGLDRAKIEASIIEWLARPIHYGFLAFVVIGIKCFLKLKTFIHWRKIVVCSGGSVMIYEGAGWPEHSRMISPGELVEEAGAYKLSVRSPT